MGGLGLALSFLILLSACGDGGPTGTDRPGDNGGTSGGNDAAGRLIGTWRTTLVVEVPGDVQTWTTTWRFIEGGGCHQTRETESLSEGFPRITERPCTFAIDGRELVVTFTGGGTLVAEFSFALFNPDRLVLDGFEYERIA